MRNPYEQLGQIFAPQQQQALQSQLLQNQLIQQAALKGRSNPLSGIGSLYGRAPDAPQLKFDVDAQDVPTGIVGGLGNAINNFSAMRNYSQQQQQYRDIMGAYEQQAQGQRDLAVQQQQRRTAFGEQVPENLRDIYNTATPEIQDKIMESVANKEIGIGYGPTEARIKKVGDVQADFAAGDEKLKQSKSRDIKLYNQDKNGTQLPLTPAQAAQAGIYGLPVDTVEQSAKRAIDQRAALQQLNINEPKAQTAGQATALDLESKKLANQSAQLANTQKQVELKYTDALKQIDLLTGQNKLQEAEKLKGIVSEGRQLYDSYITSYDKLTNGQIKLFNSKMKSLGAPYELPEKEDLKAVEKNGKVTQFYRPSTGQTYKPREITGKR